MKAYELLIFDWDGTLMDSIGKIVRCMENTAKAMALPIPSEQAVRDIIGLSMTEALQCLYPAGSVDEYQALREEYKQQFLLLDTTPTPLFSETPALLLQLRSEKYLLAVATGKARAGLERVLRETGLGDFFHASRSADDARSKPHPDMLQQLLVELKIAPERAFMVGDSVHDLNMAAGAGMDAIGVSYGAHSRERLHEAAPKAIIDSPLGLLHHL